MSIYSASATITNAGNIWQCNFAPQYGVAIHVPADGVKVRVLELMAFTTASASGPMLIERYTHDNGAKKVVPLPGFYAEFQPEDYAPDDFTGPPASRAQLQWGWAANPTVDEVLRFHRRILPAGAVLVTFPRGLVIPPGQGIWWRNGTTQSSTQSYSAVIEAGG